MIEEWKVFGIKWSPLSILAGIFYHSGVFNSEPYYNFITGLMKQEGNKIYRKLQYNVVDVNTGAYI